MQVLRTTTGQALTISYDAVKNTVAFGEHDWFPDPIRATAVPPRGMAVNSPALRLLRGRRSTRRPTPRVASIRLE